MEGNPRLMVHVDLLTSSTQVGPGALTDQSVTTPGANKSFSLIKLTSTIANDQCPHCVQGDPYSPLSSLTLLLGANGGVLFLYYCLGPLNIAQGTLQVS